MELDKGFKEFVQLLNENDVEYLVVGGYSVAHYGYPRFTGVFDIWIKPTEPNGKKVMQVLERFGFGSLGITQEDFTHPDKIAQFGVEPVRIDVMTAISGIGSFDEAYENRDQTIYDKLRINFIGYKDLIENKKATNGLKDQQDVLELSRVNKSNTISHY